MTTTSIRTEFVTDTCVRLACMLSAPPERVYRAWTEAEAICQWFLPGPGATCRAAKFDPTVGGGFELVITTPVGEASTIGSFITLDPPKLIEFSFRCAHLPADVPGSIVSVELTPEGAGTRLVLTDKQIANAEEAKGHSEGWQACVSGLVEFLATR